jgi:hypothetical protein
MIFTYPSARFSVPTPPPLPTSTPTPTDSIQREETSPSPFTKYMDSSQTSSSTFSIYVEPVLFTNTVSNASLNDSYKNIITLNALPTGPLADMTIRIQVPRLSEFNGYGGAAGFSNVGGRCIYAITRYPLSSPYSRANHNNAKFYMTAEEIPAVLGFMKENGYQIDTEITKVIQHSGLGFGTTESDGMGGHGSGKKRFICTATFSSLQTI